MPSSHSHTIAPSITTVRQRPYSIVVANRVSAQRSISQRVILGIAWLTTIVLLTLKESSVNAFAMPVQPRQVVAPEILEMASRFLKSPTISPTDHAWAVTLQERARGRRVRGGRDAPDELWFVTSWHDDPTITDQGSYCIAHLLFPSTSKNSDDEDDMTESIWKLQLWCLHTDAATQDHLLPQNNNPNDSNMDLLSVEALVTETIHAVAQTIHERTRLSSSSLQSSQVTTSTTKIKMSMAAVDPTWAPIISEISTTTTTCKDEYNNHHDHSVPPMREIYHSHCGLWMMKDPNHHDKNNPVTRLLPPQFRIRPLDSHDAPLINSHWEYRSHTSLEMVQDMIASEHCCTLGVEDTDHHPSQLLCAWILQYPDGPLGMMFCLQEYRRQGIAQALLQTATHQLRSQDLPVFGYIVDSNPASQTLVSRLGWTRICGADWMGFTTTLSSSSLPSKL
jgi:GNAT superfamily N-acetyltransferase